MLSDLARALIDLAMGSLDVGAMLINPNRVLLSKSACALL